MISTKTLENELENHHMVLQAYRKIKQSNCSAKVLADEADVLRKVKRIQKKIHPIYPFNTFLLIYDVRAEGANSDTPKTSPSHS